MASPRRRPAVPARSEAIRRDGAAVAPARRAAQPPIAAATRDSHDVRRPLLAAGWILVAAVALALRWINLDGHPLQPAEASLAMASWQIVQHQGVHLSASPLLVYLNTLTFLIFGSTDAVARAIPALLGSAVALSPFLLRRRLGEVGSLVAALTLATSPTLVFASRSVDPTLLPIGLAVGTLLLLMRSGAMRSARHLSLAAALLALLLISGPLAYDVLIILVAGALIHRPAWWRTGRADLATPDGALDGSGHSRKEAGWLGQVPSEVRDRLGLVVIATLAVAGTGLATNLSGFGDSLAAPLASWAASQEVWSPGSIGAILAVLLGYEPMSLIFGVVGAILAYRRKQLFGTFLGSASALGFVLLALGDGRHPTWVALIVVPLALLAAMAIDELPRWFQEREQRTRLGLFAIVVAPLLATSFIALGHTTLPEPIVPRSVALAPPLAILAFIASYAYAFGWRSAGRAVAALGAVVLLLFQLHAATLLNPGRELNPAELFTGTVTSPDVRQLAADVAAIQDELQIAQQIEGRNVVDTIDVESSVAEPLVWYLRWLPDVRIVRAETGAPGIAILGSQDRPPRGPYAAETYQLSVAAPPPSLAPAALWRWWIYHESSAPTVTNVKVYVRSQLARP